MNDAKEPKRPQVRVGGLRFEGFKHGIVAEGVDVTVDGNSFHNVAVPILADNSTGNIRNNRVTTDWDHKTRRQRHDRVVRTGWRKLPGPPLPVFCAQCESIFPSRSYHLSGHYFNLWGNTEPCPLCDNQNARLSEGVFDLVGEAIRVLRGPEFTTAMAQTSHGIAAAYLRNEITPEKAVASFDNVNGALGALASKTFKMGVTLLGVLASAVAVHTWYQSQNDRREHATELVQQQRERELILDALSKTVIALDGMQHDVRNDISHDPSGEPPKGEPKSDRSAGGLKPELKQKSRDIRQETIRQHRRDFGGARRR